MPPSALRQKTPLSSAPHSPATSFSRQFLSQDDIEMAPLADLTPVNGKRANPGRKKKSARLLLDARTQLTDEELKASLVTPSHLTWLPNFLQTARSQYVDGQNAIRRALEDKRMEKESLELVDQMLWGAPSNSEYSG